MIELAIRNKWITIGGSSYVCDLEGNKVLEVKGKIFTFTRKKFLDTLDGNLKYVIRNKFWKLFVRKAMIYDENKNRVAYIKRKFFSLHDHYNITSQFGKYTVRGNILGFNYEILQDDVPVGHISRKISLRDSFVLSIDETKVKDYMFIVALVIAIDNITDEIRASNSN